MNRRAPLLAALAVLVAQPALATRTAEGTVVANFIQRCVTPMLKGDAPQVADLTPPPDSAPGLRRSTTLYENIDGLVDLRVEIARSGEVGCHVLVDLGDGVKKDQIDLMLTGQLEDLGLTRPFTCDRSGFDQLIFTSAGATPKGKVLNVGEMVIPGGKALPDQLVLLAAETTDAPTPDTACLPARTVPQ